MLSISFILYNLIIFNFTNYIKYKYNFKIKINIFILNFLKK